MGNHLFFDLTTPEFVVGSEVTLLKKSGNSTAPSNSNGDVPWLKLSTANAPAGTTSNVKEIYRLQTTGGSAPATCAGQPPTFEVPYTAMYWFYASA